MTSGIYVGKRIYGIRSKSYLILIKQRYDRMNDVYSRDGRARENSSHRTKKVIMLYGCSSIGRAMVSKTIGWEFESLHPCRRKKRDE